MKRALLLIAVALATVPWWGFVASRLWSWFVVPFGVQSIGIFQAAGVALAVRFMFVPTNYATDDKDKPIGEMLGFALVWPALALGVGALYRWAAA